MKDIRKKLEHYLKEPYSRVLIPDEVTGTYTAEILEFPGCIAQGDAVQEAYEHLDKAAKAWIEAALELGQEIPPPALSYGYGGKVALRLPKSLHRQAAMAAERDGTSLNQFIVAAIAEKVGAHKLYEKLTGKMEQFFFQGFVNKTYVPISLTGQAATSMPVAFSIPNIDFSKEVTANAGNEKYSLYS